MGTLRFGADPKTSVCDPTGQLHDVGNLYAADGALFPTSSGFNPTLTITALAMYVAGNMVSPGSPLKALAGA
jgi:choline dehydrogenase-like flavoprotein